VVASKLYHVPVQQTGTRPLDFQGNPCYHTCMKNQTTEMTTQTYNGWANYETWNVSLWIQNQRFLYNTAVACVEYRNEDELPYTKFIRCMENGDHMCTNDGVAWSDELINHDEINAMMFDMHQGEN